MDFGTVEKIANAVLYEGYMLYPYRPSAVKNQQRFNFGVLYPRPYCESETGSDTWHMQTEVLVQGRPDSSIETQVRFLQLSLRRVGKLESESSRPALRSAEDLDFVDSLQVGDTWFQPWQEAVERIVALDRTSLDELCNRRIEQAFVVPSEERLEALHSPGGEVAGALLRSSREVRGVVRAYAEPCQGGCYKVGVRIENANTLPEPEADREAVLLRSLVSTHTVLGVDGGSFVSLLDPPEELQGLVKGCENVGTWPVLAGDRSARDIVLSSPILLYDYPEIAPESPTDLFDGTEIDELLSLRILTLTEAEKREIRRSDPRARDLLERIEALGPEGLMKLHGAMREISSKGAKSR